MKIHFQSIDGKLWDTEQECLYRDEECLKAETLNSLMRQAKALGSPKWNKEWKDFLEDRLGLYNHTWSDYEEWLPLWDQRHHFYKLVDLMRQAEAGS